jgi:hypothetical protein
MNWHQPWLWLWFVLGELTYMSMRAHFMVRGPRPVATDYVDFVKRAWGPLLFRFGLENAVFGMLLNPNIAPAVLHAVGWESMATTLETMIQFSPVTYMMGLCGDVAADFGVVKIPFLKDIWPQMPPPLPQKAIVESQLVTQTTEVTQLQSTTTVVPKEEKK